jgi:hypothetical protein
LACEEQNEPGNDNRDADPLDARWNLRKYWYRQQRCTCRYRRSQSGRGVGPRILAEMENRMTAKKPGPKPWKAAWSSTVVAAETALSVLAYNLTQVMNIVGINPLIVAIAA